MPPDAVATIERFCADHSPARHSEQLRLEARVGDDAVTIVERRPRWRGLPGEWVRRRIAQLRFARDSRRWTLYSADRLGRWRRYDALEPTEDVDALLGELDRDPAGAFFG